jgi:hypothetical protein
MNLAKGPSKEKNHRLRRNDGDVSAAITSLISAISACTLATVNPAQTGGIGVDGLHQLCRAGVAL